MVDPNTIPQTVATTKGSTLPCCPDLTTDPVCDVIDFHNRLNFPSSARTDIGIPISVEVILHTRFTRCSGPFALGDLVYSTTLLPGEKVRLATTDRRSRFSVDSESNLSYRSEQMSEEQYRMTAFRAFMSDSSTRDQGSGRTTDKGSWDFHGDAGGSIGFFSASADANANGSHNAESTSDYLAEHSAHASASDSQAVQATRMAHSISIGEVSTRQHSAGESEDHFESSSREFSNPNRCHAVTFLFYRINKTETIKFTLEAIDRRVIDPAAPVKVVNNPVGIRGQVATVPQDVPATVKSAIAVDALQREIEIDRLSASATEIQLPGITSNQPLSKTIRDNALAEVDQQLVVAGLLDAVGGTVSAAAQELYGFEHKSSLPTAGVIVKGCLDDCDICELTLIQDINLDLARKQLENKLLERQIELLDKSQEYRCCPDNDENDANP